MLKYMYVLKHCGGHSDFESCQCAGWSTSYCFMISFHLVQHTIRGWNVQKEAFYYFGYLSQLIFMISQTSCIGFKSRESPGHSKTGIPPISRMCFADLGLIQRTVTCINTSSFGTLYWHLFHDLNPIEELWNIMKRCQSLPNN